MKIIPALNTKTFEETLERIKILYPLAKEFHLDISSKDFTNFETWQNPNLLDKITYEINLDLHLMIPLKPLEILKWNKNKVKNFILHLEFSVLPDGLLKMAKKTKKRIIIAISPQVNIKEFEKYFKFIDGILVLGVNPGLSGQKFIDSTYKVLEYVNIIRAKYKLKLFIDGGINKDNIKNIIKFKPDKIIIGSSIFNNDDPIINFNYFQELIKENKS